MIFNTYCVKSRTKYFVALQQCRENQLLHFHGNTEHSCIVDNYIYSNNGKKGNVLLCFPGSNGYPNTPTVTLYVNCLFLFLNVGSPALHTDVILFPELCKI